MIRVKKHTKRKLHKIVIKACDDANNKNTQQWEKNSH